MPYREEEKAENETCCLGVILNDLFFLKEFLLIGNSPDAQG